MTTVIQGSFDAPTIISKIVEGLTATDDFTLIDENAVDNFNQTGYCLEHVPTGQYVTFIHGRALFADNSSNYNDNPRHTLGIRVIFSKEWDTDAHTYSGTTMRGFIPFYARGDSGDLTTLSMLVSPNVFSTSLWIDKYGVIMTVQNTYSYGIGVFAALEFFPNTWVEYDDAEECPVVLYCKRSADAWGARSPIGMTHANRPADGHPAEGFFYIRPYRFACQTYASNGNSLAGLNQHEGAFVEREAYRSEANNKVYFQFPKYENDVASARKPYAETRRWFKVSVTGGLQIGDILSWVDSEGTTHKFIVAVVDGSGMYCAIPYESAFDYAVSPKQ